MSKYALFYSWKSHPHEVAQICPGIGYETRDQAERDAEQKRETGNYAYVQVVEFGKSYPWPPIQDDRRRLEQLEREGGVK